MLATFRKLIGAPPAASRPAIPAGERAYAVGDVHGCGALFEALVEAIDADDAARGAARTTVVLLGDLVDRGPDSAGVVRTARAWQDRRTVRLIAGNHEEMFLTAFADVDTFRHLLKYGGRETVLSYVDDVREWNEASIVEAQEIMRRAVPQADIDFLERTEDMVEIGDYLFVHAGIAPGVPLHEQKSKDLRWIREPFLSHRSGHGKVVVHGHTISDRPEVRDNRIGIDTGAYETGRLTAIGLEGTERWLIEAAEDEDGAITVKTRAAR